MVHFLRQLQAYCQLEVIECSWQSLMDFTDKREGDMDALIAAHRTYLDRVVRKVLLLGAKRDKQVSRWDGSAPSRERADEVHRRYASTMSARHSTSASNSETSP